MNGQEDGIVIDDSGTVYYSDPEQITWIKRMEEASRKADKIWKEDGGTEEEEDVNEEDYPPNN